MKNDLFFIKSKVTGGHWALKSEKSKKPLVNIETLIGIIISQSQ